MNLIQNYKNLSDVELLNLLRESDHAAYTEIYNRYFYLMYTHAYKKLRDEEQAKDVIQDLFAGLWFKREFELKTNSLGGYLYTSVRNKVFDLFAREQVKEKYVDSVKSFFASNKSISADYRVREKELKAYIDNEIQKLPPKMKLIFELSRKEQLSHQEIAERLDTTRDNVSTQLTTALRRLKTKLGLIAYVYFLYMFR
jgi:RNA polymerase sigma-70 factor (family 1)